ncbi:MAG: PilZ domain-containing protein [Sandaracinus sp.]
MFDIPDIKRRNAPRRMARIRCEAVSADGFVAVGGTLRDLSETGLLLEAEAALAVGEELYLSFQAPRTSQWVGLVARVSRATQLLDRSCCLAGLVIEEIDPVERSILAASIERLPAHPQKRRAPRDYAAWVAQVSGLHGVSLPQS